MSWPAASIGVFLASLFWLVASVPVVATQAEVIVVAVDADPSGNTPREIASIEECVSVDVGGEFQVDVVVPPPGIPADEGIAAYEMRFFYDVRVISVIGEDSRMLLAQAAGSRPLSFSDPAPSRTGDYLTIAADFGAAGIEPAGASETGQGVLTRLVLKAEAAGFSSLGLANVALGDDAGNSYEVQAPQRGTVYAGSPCPQATPSPSPAPTATPAPTSAPTPRPSPATGDSAGATAGSSGTGSGGPATGIGTLAPSAQPIPLVGATLLAAGTAGLAAAGALLRRRRRTDSAGGRRR